jgi:GT2 family glycosyltransferase
MPEFPHHTPVAVFCSVNRPEILHESVLCLKKQTIPCPIFVSVPSDADVSVLTRQLPGIEIVYGTRGASAQRNRALRMIQGNPEFIAFFDDDMEVEANYMEELQRTYRAHRSIVLVNGANLAHGIYRAGTLTREIARQLIEDQLKKGLPQENCVPALGGYGGRMSIRGFLLGKVEFDERLPLYSFMEDYDFTLACRKFGDIAENPRALTVHIEVASGRVSLDKRGYSEVVNPIYIARKNGVGFRGALWGAFCVTLKNAKAAAFSTEKRRFSGNLVGWRKLLVGQIDPEYILRMQ